MTEEKKDETKEVVEETTKEEPKKEEVKENVQKEEVKIEETSKVEEKKEEIKKDTPKAEKPEPSGKFKDLIKTIEGLTALELAELVKELEERFGVSAATPVAVAGTAPASGGEEAEEKSSYTVVLTEAGGNKISAIKVVREITQLGLKESKDLVEGAPKELKKDVPKEEAEEMKKKIEAAGAKAELK